MGKTKKKDNGNINVKINKPFSDKKETIPITIITK